MKKLFFLPIISLLLANCNISPMVGPDGVEIVRNTRSSLGFYIYAADDYVEGGGTITQAHKDLPDKWWPGLMNDLKDAGYGAANPNDIFGYVKIELRQPRGEHEYIYCDNFSGAQGACYHNSTRTMEVPGNYPTSTLTERPRSQPLKHEMLHYFCYQKLGHNCLDGDGKHI